MTHFTLVPKVHSQFYFLELCVSATHFFFPITFLFPHISSPTGMTSSAQVTFKGRVSPHFIT